MRLTIASGLAALVSGLLLAGCATDPQEYGPATGCTGTTCQVDTGGPSLHPTTSGHTGDSGTGGAAAGIDLTGTVHVYTSPDFNDNGVVLKGTANIKAYMADGSVLTAPYTSPSFEFTSIQSGPRWFFVEDTSAGTSGILSTFSFADPISGAFTLPAIDLEMMQGIAGSLPTVAAKGVSNLTSQVILAISKGGVPAKGIAVSGGSAGGQVAYDSGAGYSDQSVATGFNGVAIIFNAALSGAAKVVLSDTTATPPMSYDVHLYAAPNAATLYAVSLD